jgi:hypothetical protein
MKIRNLVMVIHGFKPYYLIPDCVFYFTEEQVCNCLRDDNKIYEPVGKFKFKGEIQPVFTYRSKYFIERSAFLEGWAHALILRGNPEWKDVQKESDEIRRKRL